MMVLTPRWFLLLSIVLIVITRSAIILPNAAIGAGGPDLPIYREAGSLVADGGNPYDPASNAALRSEARTIRNTFYPGIEVSQSAYDYYVGGNLPGSTAFYGLVEAINPGSLKWWRLVLAFGDVLTAIAAWYFLARARVRLDTTAGGMTFVLATALYPSMIYWGTIFSEDKQYQTALMLALAGLTFAPPSRRLVSSIAIGLIGGLSVAFKALGIFLLPQVLHYFRRRPMREAGVAVLAAGLLGSALTWRFGTAFVTMIASRAKGGSSSLAISHGSPWRLVPEPLAQPLRPALCLALLAAIAVFRYRARLDLINSCAATMVVFTCLWLVSGSMDRMNMAMMFAIMCTATLSTARWRSIVAINFAVQFPIYACVAARLRDPAWFFSTEIPDAAATAVFLASYFALLFWPIRNKVAAETQAGAP